MLCGKETYTTMKRHPIYSFRHAGPFCSFSRQPTEQEELSMRNTRQLIPLHAFLGAALCSLALPMATFAALKYEPSDYVQDGLVMHLDGIRNAGANRPHDPTASTWVDLSGNVGGVMFVMLDASDTSAWTDGGYLFTGKSYGITTKLLPEMANLTIEAFGDFPANQQRTSPNQWQEYANYVSANASGKDFGIFTYNGQATLFWKTDNFGVPSRPQFGSWNCKNFSCVLSVSMGNPMPPLVSSSSSSSDSSSSYSLKRYTVS